MSIKIIKLGDTITALQFDVMNCIRNEENISKVIDKSETLLKEIEINTEVATSTDQPKENNNPTVIDFFDYKPPKDWYMTLFNTILDYCTSRNIINEKTINKGIEQLLKKFVKYSELIDYLDNAKKFIVLNSESIILDTENGNKWNTSSFEKNYIDTDVYLIFSERIIKSMTFSEIFAKSKICGLFKTYNKSDFKPYNPLREKVALDNDTYNYYKPVFTVAPQLDKDLEKKFRHGAVFLCKVLKNMAENNLTKYRWLLGYIAHMIQYPATLVQQYIVINGPRNIGKNTIMQPLADMFGEYGIIKQDMNGLTGRFNTDLDRKVFVCLDETEDGKKSERIFKGLIGNKSVGVEGKAKDRKQIKNFTHVVMMSNEIDGPFGLGERKGVGFFPKKIDWKFDRYYRDCVLKSDDKENKDTDPVKYNQFLNYLWYQLSQIDFVALGYDPTSYPNFARKAVLKAMLEHPQSLDQSVLGSCIEYHRILLESIKKLECGQEISSKLFDIKTLKNLKSSIGQLERYNNKETKKLSTYLNMIVCYCAQRAYDDGFTTTRVNPVIEAGHLVYINWSGGKNEIGKIKDKLGKLYREYNIYPKDGDMRYKIMHPADVLKNIGAID